MQLIACDRAHAAAILDIFNDVIAHTTALWDYAPRSMDSMEQWFAAKEGKYPVIGAVDENGKLLGFASYGPFRAFPAYKYTVEHSIHIHRDHRRQGLGRQLVEAIVAHARAQGYHTIVAGIEAGNTGSKALHEALGFEACGVIREAGFKFGRWLDLEFYQRVLDTPVDPVDG
ncbi:MAG: N-acetyltransferase [Candidatus Hydrogenedentes bacterium]|nr:N-acetyltransferase [Candidatus Hydrogenedentota bacterium]